MSIVSKIRDLIASANTTTNRNSTTLTDAMQLLIEGYGHSVGNNYYQHATGLERHFGYLWEYSIRLPEHINIIAHNVVQISNFMTGRTAAAPYASGCKHLSLQVKEASENGIRSLATGLSDLETISILTDSGESLFDRNVLCGLNHLKSFTGVVIDANHSYWQYVTSSNPIHLCPALEDFRLKQNSMKQLITYQLGGMPNLSDATLISIANACVKDTTAGIKLHAVPKARCAEIIGRVSQVESSETTYDVFTADTAGTVTLEYFITMTKGVTLS